MAGPGGSGSPRRQKAGGGGERNDENTAEPGSRIAAARLRRRRRAGQKQSPQQNSAAKPLGKISGQRLCRTKTKYHQQQAGETLSPQQLKTVAAAALLQHVWGSGRAGPGRTTGPWHGPRRSGSRLTVGLRSDPSHYPSPVATGFGWREKAEKMCRRGERKRGAGKKGGIGERVAGDGIEEGRGGGREKGPGDRLG